MSFLNNRTVNPHIHLYALALPPLANNPQAPLQRLNLLAKTRRFAEIRAAAALLPDISFPSLNDKLALAQKQSEELRASLNQSRIFDILRDLDEQSKASDPDFEKIDLQQERAFKLAQVQFDQGRFSDCWDLLVQLEKQDLKEELWLKATWARVYCEILLGRECSRSLESLKKKLEDIETEELAFLAKEKRDTSKVMQRFYAQKEEFLLLALLALLKKAGEQDLQKLVEFCTADKSYFSVVQLTFPELLRYLIVALALNKTLHHSRSFDLFKLVEVINRKVVKYNDSFTEYISLLEIEYDFEGAAAKIEDCRKEIREDPFLVGLEERIVEGLQFLYFKLACKVYETLPLEEVAKFTGLKTEEAELWILSYIRSGDIEAKIDSINSVLVNNKGRQSLAEKYVDVVPSVSTFVNSLSRAIASQ